MDKNKQLIKNTIIIFLGKFSTQLISIILLPIYTKYLSSEDYGTVDLIITYISLLVPVITVQLEMATFRYIVDVRGNYLEIKKIISNVLYTICILLLAFVSVCMILDKYIVLKYKYLIIFNIIVCIFSNLLLQVARGFGDNTTYSIASLISGLTSTILNIILIVGLGYGANGMLLAMIVANSFSCIYIFSKLRIYNYISLRLKDRELIKQLLKYSIPLVPNGISWWIVNVSDRTIISIFLGVASNGIYATSNKFSAIIIKIFSIFNMSWTESASLHINSDDRDEFFSNTINKSFKLFSCLCIGIIACIPFIFPILINSQYDEAYLYIPILLLSTLFNIVVCFYSAIYVAKKMTKQVAATSIIGAFINIFVNLIFIKNFGLYATALSTFISYFSMAIYRHFDVKKYVNIFWDIKYIVSYSILFIFSMIMYYRNSVPTNILNLIIVSCYSLYINKDMLKGMFGMMKNKKIALNK